MSAESERYVRFTVSLSSMAVLLMGCESRSGSSSSDHSRPTWSAAAFGIVDPDSTPSYILRAIDIAPRIRGSYTFDPGSGLYTYTYSVTNGSTATNAIDHFALAPVPEPLGVTLPGPAWDHFYSFEERRDALLWTVTDAGPAPAGWDSVSLWPSPFAIQPGDSATGFSLTTRAAPTVVSYFVQGPHELPTNGETASFPVPTLFQNSLTGEIVGPGSVPHR